MTKLRRTIHRGGAIGLTVAVVAMAVVVSRATALLAEPEPVPAPPAHEAEARESAEPAPPRAEARAEGRAVPGRRLLLSAEGSEGRDLRYRWVQVRGPRARPDDPGQPRTTIVVPEGADALGFELIVSNADGMDVAPLSIPIEGSAATTPAPSQDAAPVAVPAPEPSGAPRADAGDDQIALVGHQVTLNGMRSTPRGKVGYRWLQVGGPPVSLKVEEGYIFSFVPTAAGLYRFALVVASGGSISEPDVVSVTVGAPAAPTASASASAALPPSPAFATAEPVAAPEATRDLARRAIASVRGGTEAAERLASSFEFTAERMELYGTYAETYGEMSRRLEEIVPADPAWRALWLEKVFGPLTARMVEAMLGEGLDLRRPEGQTAELNDRQKAELARLFREIAEGFRASGPRTPPNAAPASPGRLTPSGP